jgi:two-component system, LytTR family, response regulator
MPADRPAAVTAVIADDEALARSRIAELLARRGGVRVLAQCATGPATADAVRALKPDILFLDVHMPGLDGFEVLATLRPEERPIVIFSTAYDEYALAAFEVHAVDYLLKPFADQRFDESLRRVELALVNHRANDLHERLRFLLEQLAPDPGAGLVQRSGAGGYLERFAVRAGEQFTVVEASAVDSIEAARDYVSLRSGSRRYLLRTTMASLEQRLDPARFLRIHRSTIVQIDRVRGLHADVHGEYDVILEHGVRLRVGRSYRDAVLARLGVQR